LVSFFLIATPIRATPHELDFDRTRTLSVENFLSGEEKISLKPSLEGIERLTVILDR